MTTPEPEGLLEALRVAGLQPPAWSTPAYWDARYAVTESSGSGSRGVEAQAKADAISKAASTFGVRSILDLGCGDGHVAGLLRLDRGVSYVGYDPSPNAIQLARKHVPDGAFEFTSEMPDAQFDMVISCDVLFHLISDKEYWDYMHHLFASATILVLVWSSDNDFVGAPHVRDRCWTPDVPASWQVIVGYRVPFDQKYLNLCVPR